MSTDYRIVFVKCNNLNWFGYRNDWFGTLDRSICLDKDIIGLDKDIIGLDKTPFGNFGFSLSFQNLANLSKQNMEVWTFFPPLWMMMSHQSLEQLFKFLEL